jgi:hypothetical protein
MHTLIVVGAVFVTLGSLKASVAGQAKLAKANISSLNRIWWGEPGIKNAVVALDSILELTR